MCICQHTHTHVQKVLDALDPDAITAALQKHEELLKEHSASLESQAQSLAQTEKALKETSTTVSQLDGRVGEMGTQLAEFMERVKALEVRLPCLCIAANNIARFVYNLISIQREEV